MPATPTFNRQFQAKRRAAEIFVDRDEPKALFARALDEFTAAPASPRLLAFHGVGGQGKTALCRVLIKLCSSPEGKARALRPALIDLHVSRPADEIHAWVSLHNAIAGATGASFPCFELALEDYWAQAYPDRPPVVLGKSKLAPLAADFKETAASAFAGAAGKAFDAATDLASAETLSHVSSVATDLVGSLPLVGPIVKRVSAWAITKGWETYLKRNSAALELLYGGDVAPDALTIKAALPDILAHELALHARRKPKDRLIVFIDEYENALPSGGAAGVTRTDPWDAALREFFAQCALGEHVGRCEGEGYRYQAGLLLVLFGRERLRWEELDAGWAADLTDRQHELEGLSDGDADRFLTEAAVTEPEVRRAVIAASLALDPEAGGPTVHPIMLDLSVQIYFDLLSMGRRPSVEDFTLTGRSYRDRRRELFARFTRNYVDLPGLEGLLRRLACTRRFTREVAEHLVRTFGVPFDMLHFDDLRRLSFVTETDDCEGFVLHKHVRDALRQSLSPEDARATHLALAIWHKAASTPPSLREANVRHVVHLCEAIVQHAAADEPEGDLLKGDRFKLFGQPAFVALTGDAIREALATERERLPASMARVVELASVLAAMESALRRFDAAVALDEEVLALARDRFGLEGAASLHFLQCLTHSLAAAGKLERASDLTDDALALARRTQADDGATLAKSLTSAAEIRSKTARNAEAEALLREALALNRAVPHGDGAVAASLSALAKLLALAGGLEEAAELFEEALMIARRASPPSNDILIDLLADLGDARVLLGDYVRARTLLEDSVALSRANLPEFDSSRLISLTKLAVACVELGDYAQAKAIGEEAMAVQRGLPALGAPALLQAIAAVAAALSETGEPQGALELQQEALALGRTRLSPNHHDFALLYNGLGLSLRELGRYEDAILQHEEALAVARRPEFRDDYILACCVCNLALAHAATGERNLARTLLEETLGLMRRCVPADHPDLARLLYNIGNNEAELGFLDSARARLVEAGRIWAAAGLHDHPGATQTAILLAMVAQPLASDDSTPQGPATDAVLGF